MASAPGPGRRRASVVASVVLVVVAAVAGAVLAVAFVVMGRHPGGESATTPPPTATAAITTSTSSSAMSDAMWDWQLRAGDHFKESARALEQVSAAVDANDQEAVRSGCQRLHDTNAVGLQADLPTPDPALTAELQRMIDDVNIAAHACLRFADTRHPEDASTYQDYLTRAIDHLAAAKQILNEDLGKG